MKLSIVGHGFESTKVSKFSIYFIGLRYLLQSLFTVVTDDIKIRKIRINNQRVKENLFCGF